MSIFNTSNFGLQNPRNSARVGTSTLNRPNQSKVRQVENVANYRICSLFLLTAFLHKARCCGVQHDNSSV